MIVTYQGVESFRISQGDLTLAVNPQSKVSADITLFTAKRGEIAEKSGFVIDGPGEYEIKDIFIKGFPDRTFLITFEGLKLCFLGTNLAGSDSLGNQEEIEDVDILFVRPDAYKAAVALEPAVIIPMNYDKDSLTKFLKEGGEEKVEPQDKFVVKKKDLEGKESEIVVLKEE
ncbi:MAG: hypothetical protein Q7S54_00840 [bacterium]|nr:hypothetical protein [bacterium]